jgi:glycosyltransferase involved in cell wall biosynthesis
VPEVSVIVPARDAAQFIEPLIAALARQDLDGRSEVIVVDNGSRDETAALAEGAAVVDRVIRRPRGAGPGAARNDGARAASGELLAFIDADCRPTPEWLRAGLAAAASCDLVQGRVVPDPAMPSGPFDRTLSVGAAHGLFESANLFVRRELFEQLDGFPAGLEGDGEPFGEDVIFGWQARRAGARTGFCAEALVYHAVLHRGPAAFVAERNRLRLFPALAARVPELREAFFYRRYFHSRRSAAFDAALAGLAAAMVTERALPLALAVPYLRLVGRSARRWGRRRAAPVALAEAAADGVGALALVRGSIETRSLLL